MANGLEELRASLGERLPDQLRAYAAYFVVGDDRLGPIMELAAKEIELLKEQEQAAHAKLTEHGAATYWKCHGTPDRTLVERIDDLGIKFGNAEHHRKVERDEVKRLEATIEAGRRREGELLALLRDVEWRATHPEFLCNACPICMGVMGRGHQQSCELAAALATNR